MGSSKMGRLRDVSRGRARRVKVAQCDRSGLVRCVTALRGRPTKRIGHAKALCFVYARARAWLLAVARLWRSLRGRACGFLRTSWRQDRRNDADADVLATFGIDKHAPVGLVGRAVLPAATFVDGPPSGVYAASTSRRSPRKAHHECVSPALWVSDSRRRLLGHPPRPSRLAPSGSAFRGFGAST